MSESKDTVYLVCYDGAHGTNVLCATSNETMAIYEANKEQGFRVEQWVSGKMIEKWFYNGTAYGPNARGERT